MLVAVTGAWVIASWLLHGGALAVALERPDGRAATARVFGAGGVDTFLAFARVGLLSAVARVPVLAIAGASLAAMATRLELALDDVDLVVALFIGVVPPLLAWLVLDTVGDLARVDLARRRRAGAPLAATRAYVTALGDLVRRPRALAHAGLGTLAVALVVVGYAALVSRHALLGTGGAVALLVLRQGVVLARLAIRAIVIGGQVELTRPARDL
ncbi:MAG: hypothetical protein R2939_21015 [Kofleriaceae bacterium]